MSTKGAAVAVCCGFLILLLTTIDVQGATMPSEMYTETTEKVNVDWCTQFGYYPCSNGGTCVNRVDSYSCYCPPGWSGTDCGYYLGCQGPNSCSDNGYCYWNGYFYYCACNAGYTGANCEINSNGCTYGQCQNGGTCFMLGNQQACYCPPGYTGTNCETVITSCQQLSCQNGGWCEYIGYAYMCYCPVGFLGRSCQNLPESPVTMTMDNDLTTAIFERPATTVTAQQLTTGMMSTATVQPTRMTIASSPHLQATFNGTLLLTPLAGGAVFNLGNLTLACVNSYVGEFRKSYHDIIGRVNSQIKGGLMCPSTPGLKLYAGDIVMLGAGSCNGNEIAVQFSSWLSADRSHSMELLESCAMTAGNFIEIYSNWRQPTIAAVFNCAPVAFNPPRFDNSGVKYICSDSEA